MTQRQFSGQTVSLLFTNILTVFRTANPTVPRSWVTARHLIWMCWHSLTFPDPRLCFPHSPTLSFSLPSFTHPFNYGLSSVLPSVAYFAREMVVDVKYRVGGRNKRDRKALLDVTHHWWMLTCYLRCMNTRTYHTFMYVWWKKGFF